jgi:hypothetical protein
MFFLRDKKNKPSSQNENPRVLGVSSRFDVLENLLSGFGDEAECFGSDDLGALVVQNQEDSKEVGGCHYDRVGADRRTTLCVSHLFKPSDSIEDNTILIGVRIQMLKANVRNFERNFKLRLAFAIDKHGFLSVGSHYMPCLSCESLLSLSRVVYDLERDCLLTLEVLSRTIKRHVVQFSTRTLLLYDYDTIELVFAGVV